MTSSEGGGSVGGCETSVPGQHQQQVRGAEGLIREQLMVSIIALLPNLSCTVA